MKASFVNWHRLFLFCLGLFIASSFTMKWIETDFIYNNQPISIFGLELFYSKEKIMEIFSGINDKVKTVLGYHLYFDFAFMAGVYPGIACLCMIAAKKVKRKWLLRVLFAFAFLQLFAWTFDIIENYHLLKWLKNPVIGNEFGFYHVVVYSKWGIALSGILAALITYLGTSFQKKNEKSKN